MKLLKLFFAPNLFLYVLLVVFTSSFDLNANEIKTRYLTEVGYVNKYQVELKKPSEAVYEASMKLLKIEDGKEYWKVNNEPSADLRVYHRETGNWIASYKDGNLIAKGERNHTHQRTMFGLLGQQVREATKKLGLGYNDFAGFSDQEYENKDNPDWKKSYTMEDKTIQLTYDDFIAPLIKSVQELSAEVTELKAQLKTT